MQKKILFQMFLLMEILSRLKPPEKNSSVNVSGDHIFWGYDDAQ